MRQQKLSKCLVMSSNERSPGGSAHYICNKPLYYMYPCVHAGAGAKAEDTRIVPRREDWGKRLRDMNIGS